MQKLVVCWSSLGSGEGGSRSILCVEYASAEAFLRDFEIPLKELWERRTGFVAEYTEWVAKREAFCEEENLTSPYSGLDAKILKHWHDMNPGPKKGPGLDFFKFLGIEFSIDEFRDPESSGASFKYILPEVFTLEDFFEQHKGEIL